LLCTQAHRTTLTRARTAVHPSSISPRISARRGQQRVAPGSAAQQRWQCLRLSPRFKPAASRRRDVCSRSAHRSALHADFYVARYYVTGCTLFAVRCAGLCCSPCGCSRAAWISSGALRCIGWRWSTRSCQRRQGNVAVHIGQSGPVPFPPAVPLVPIRAVPSVPLPPLLFGTLAHMACRSAVRAPSRFTATTAVCLTITTANASHSPVQSSPVSVASIGVRHSVPQPQPQQRKRRGYAYSHLACICLFPLNPSPT
jgi:hypothetical protein